MLRADDNLTFNYISAMYKRYQFAKHLIKIVFIQINNKVLN